MLGTADDDLRLSSGSPCINAGPKSHIPFLGTTDLDGHPRILCDRVDMGAYEWGIGDYDCDGVIDLWDFSAWLECVSGLDNEYYEDACASFDFDGDFDIDLLDWGGFQRGFGEP